MEAAEKSIGMRRRLHFEEPLEKEEEKLKDFGFCVHFQRTSSESRPRSIFIFLLQKWFAHSHESTSPLCVPRLFIPRLPPSHATTLRGPGMPGHAGNLCPWHPVPFYAIEARCRQQTMSNRSKCDTSNTGIRHPTAFVFFRGMARDHTTKPQTNH
jgi:hypothetical protein